MKEISDINQVIISMDLTSQQQMNAVICCVIQVHSLDFIKWVREKKIKWLGVDCGSADHPMNTKIRDWEPMEAEKCDAIFREKYGKSLNEVYPCQSIIRQCI